MIQEQKRATTARVHNCNSRRRSAPNTTHLCLDVQYASAPCTRYFADGHETGTIEVAGELGMFYESVFLKEGLEPIMRNEVIVFAVFLARTWRPSCV